MKYISVRFMLFVKLILIISFTGDAISQEHHHGEVLQKDTLTADLHANDTILPAVGLFGHHELTPTVPFVRERMTKDKEHNYIIIWVMLSFLSLTLAKFLFPVRFKDTLLAAIQIRFFNQLEREGGLMNSWVTFFLFFNFLVSLSFFLYLSIYWLGFGNFFSSVHPMLLLLYGFVAVAGFYFVKYMVMRIVAWVFSTTEQTNSYFRNIFVINQLAGIILLPVLLIYFLNPADWLFLLAWGVFGLAALYKLIKVSWVGLTIPGFSSYHLILYLCAIEIAPVVFMIKTFKNLVIS